MKRGIFFVCFLSGLLACHHRKKNNERVLLLNKKAANIFLKNFSNPDSLDFALSLVDSAINMQPDRVNSYYMKITILRELDRYDQVVTVYDKILHLQKNNWLFLMGKGAAFEHLNKLDSANYYYHLALDHFEDIKWKRDAYKEVQKAILYGMLRDTSNFNIQLDLLKKKYSNEKDFNLLFESLKSFDRSELINGDKVTGESYPNKGE
jgi:tetratricopeptide (TPR) repeat protein